MDWLRTLSVFVGLVTAAICAHSAFAGQSTGQQAEQPEGEVRFEGRTVAEWIADWDSTDSTTTQNAKRALTAIGAPAVNELAKVIQRGGRASTMAIQTLTEMGPAARDALPMLLEIAASPPGPNPTGWSAGVSIRDYVVSNARNMGWAAGEWIPVLERIVNNAAEPERTRQYAVVALGGMGAAAEPILERMTTGEDAFVRKWSVEALATILESTGRSKAALYEEVINRNVFDPNVPDFLVRMQGRYNNGSPNPLTQRVKAQLRQRLAEQPDAQTAFALATIIRNGLANTDLMFAAPSDSYRSQYDREDPAENYGTLAAALEIALAHAAKDSELAGRAGRSLARLRLLQGDWEGMNAAVSRIGQPPIPADVRATLPAPPFDWTNLRDDWQPADEAVRTGTAAIELQFEKDGQPLAGAHVLVKRRPAPDTSGQLSRTGIRADTFFLSTQPLESEPYDAFGYRASDRAMTRYAVSDASGKIHIEKLPAIPIVVEVLIPTSNFSEPGQNWDLLMELSPGALHPTWIQPTTSRRGGPATQPATPQPGERPPLPSVSRRDGPAVVMLTDGETLKYPKFIVRQQLRLNVAEWSPIDANDFVLRWAATTDDQAFDHYEVEMMLTAPCETPSVLSEQRAIRSTTEEAIDTQWPVGQEGVGGQRLRPGNIYMFEVRAVDREKKVLARLPRTRVWVPWSRRETAPPIVDRGPRGVPFFDQMWWNTGVQTAGGARVDNRQLIAEFLTKNANAFEYDYVRLGRAWLQCLDGQVDAGRAELEKLVAELPAGNVVRGTARELLRKLTAGEELSKRFEFVADE
jgi:hypothetical protein